VTSSVLLPVFFVRRFTQVAQIEFGETDVDGDSAPLFFGAKRPASTTLRL